MVHKLSIFFLCFFINGRIWEKKIKKKLKKSTFLKEIYQEFLLHHDPYWKKGSLINDFEFNWKKNGKEWNFLIISIISLWILSNDALLKTSAAKILVPNSKIENNSFPLFIFGSNISLSWYICGCLCLFMKFWSIFLFLI